jgi:hypothetical protein
LAINAKEGEILSPKQKDRTTTNVKIFKNFSNWYLNVFDLSSIGIYKKLVKPSWKLRGEFYSGGFCLVKGKTFETGGENFKSWKCFSKSCSYTFDYLQKGFEKIFQKNLQKQNKWCKRGPKC